MSSDISSGVSELHRWARQARSRHSALRATTATEAVRKSTMAAYVRVSSSYPWKRWRLRPGHSMRRPLHRSNGVEEFALHRVWHHQSQISSREIQVTDIFRSDRFRSVPHIEIRSFAVVIASGSCRTSEQSTHLRPGTRLSRSSMTEQLKPPNQALQTTPMTRSVCEKTIEFDHPQRGV